ncbi:hypothetical protein ACP70R_000562 [Stipagrostis hirtigluma subsp. patula]
MKRSDIEVASDDEPIVQRSRSLEEIANQPDVTIRLDLQLSRSQQTRIRKKRQHSPSPMLIDPNQVSYGSRDTEQMAEHLQSLHGWPSTELLIGEAVAIRITASESRRLIICSDKSLFVLAKKDLGPCSALTLVCIGHPRTGCATKNYRCKLSSGILPSENNTSGGAGLCLVAFYVPFRRLFDRAPAVEESTCLLVSSKMKCPQTGDIALNLRIDHALL